MVLNYSWSLKRYMKLCAKIGFEFLCKFKCADFCLDSCFDEFRRNILNDQNFDQHIIPYYDGKGFQINRFTAPGWLSYCDIKLDTTVIPFLKVNIEYCRQVFIYEVSGHILMSIKLFDMEPCLMIIANNMHLSNIYYIEYDSLLKSNFI